MANYAVVCLDETGSMSQEVERVVTSLNEYVQNLPARTHITVFKFNSDSWTKFYDGTKAKWTPMTEEDYNPNSMTPLYDSVAKAINHANSLVKSTKDKVLVMVDTDGYENDSREYSQDNVKALVEEKKKAGWDFFFMAHGLDRVSANNILQQGTNLGMMGAAGPQGSRGETYRVATNYTAAYFASDNS